MKAIAATLGVARSNLAQRIRGDTKKRGPYLSAAGAELLPKIRAILDDWLTYGHRRVGAVPNRLRSEQGPPHWNHKRICQIVTQANLLLTRHTGKHPSRPHEGKVVKLCTGAYAGLQIALSSLVGTERLRANFAIDPCDQAVPALEASTAGFTEESVRNVIVLAAEARFSSSVTLIPIDFLTDNDSADTERETLTFAPRLNLVLCFTRVRSPEFNGIAESFEKTFKHDYVFLHDQPDAEIVMTQLD